MLENVKIDGKNLIIINNYIYCKEGTTIKLNNKVDNYEQIE